MTLFQSNYPMSAKGRDLCFSLEYFKTDANYD